MSDLIDDFNQILQATVDQTAAVNDLEVTYRGKVQDIDNKVDAAVADTQQAIVDMNANAQPHIDAMKEFVGSELLHMQGEVDMETRRGMVNNLYPNSGVVHGGYGYGNSVSSRLGLWTHVGHGGDNDTVLHLGRHKNTGYDRKSPLPYTVVNMNGFLVHLVGRAYDSIEGNDYAGLSWANPPGELGTRVYNRDTGEFIDYLYEADPKYPDEEQPLGSTPTAQGITFNEAVYRAHDLFQKNANGRHGIGDGTDRDTGWIWSPGHVTFEPETNRWTVRDVDGTDGSLGIQLGDRVKVGDFVKVSCRIINKENVGNVAGIRFRSLGPSFLASKASDYNSQDQMIGGTPDGEYVEGIYQCVGEHTYNNIGILVSNYGCTAVIEDFKIELCNEDGIPLLETVTEREDVYAVEGFLRPINPGDFVYPFGAVDATWTGMCGVTTVEDTTRPDSFFAHYKGQENPRHGKGVVFHNCTPEEQAKLCSDPRHNIYRMADGQVVQFCYRPKVYLGYGNGPWGYLEGSSYLQFKATSFNRPIAQGALDEEADYKTFSSTTVRWTGQSSSTVHSDKVNDDPLYRMSHSGYSYATARAYNSEAYCLVFCTIPTLNQGAYSHKNRLGTGEFRVKDQYTYLDWKSVENVIGREPRPEEHFLLTEGEPTGFIGRHATSGSKESGRSGRPDGKVLGRLYSGGYGAPVLRHPYFGALKADTLEAAEEVRCQVMGDLYPGMERAPRSHIINVGTAQLVRYGHTGIKTSEDNNPEIYKAVGDYTGFYHDYLWYIITSGGSGNMLPNMLKCYMFGTNDGVDYAFKLDSYGSGVDVFNLTPLDGYPPVTDIVATDFLFTLDDCIIIICFEGRYIKTHSNINPNLYGPEVSGAFETSVVYGNPKDLAQINRYKNGWDGYWGGFTDVPGLLKLPRMSRETFGEAMTGDLGATWSKPYGGTPPIDVNRVTLTGAMLGQVWEVNFLAKASVFKEALDLKVALGKESLGKMHIIKTEHWDYGALNLDYFTNKVPTHNATPYFQTREFNDVTVQKNGGLYLSSISPLTHDPITFPLQITAVATKLAMIASLNGNRLTLQGRSQELIPKFEDRAVTTFTAGGGADTIEEGRAYIFQGFNNEVMNDKIFIAEDTRAVSNEPTMFSGWTLDLTSGKILRESDGVLGFGGMRLYDKAYYWGDSNYLKVGSYIARDTDLNGNLIAVCRSELVLPYGIATI